MDKILISVENLTGGYGENHILHNIDFQLNKGDFLGVIGPNGSGKSTLLKLLSRILQPHEGRVLIENNDIRHTQLKKISQMVAFVPQETLVNFSFSAEEIVQMGRIPHLKRLQHESKIDRDIVLRSMEMTDTINLRKKSINELSAGERQRVIVARALAQEPIILFLDEPISHLDIGHQVQMLNLLKKLNSEKTLSILVVLHDLNIASEYCNRIIILNEGKIFDQGRPEEVLTCQNIETVYKTLVTVRKNPMSGKPHIILQTATNNQHPHE